MQRRISSPMLALVGLGIAAAAATVSMPPVATPVTSQPQPWDAPSISLRGDKKDRKAARPRWRQ